MGAPSLEVLKAGLGEPGQLDIVGTLSLWQGVGDGMIFKILPNKFCDSMNL